MEIKKLKNDVMMNYLPVDIYIQSYLYAKEHKPEAKCKFLDYVKQDLNLKEIYDGNKAKLEQIIANIDDKDAAEKLGNFNKDVEVIFSYLQNKDHKDIENKNMPAKFHEAYVKLVDALNKVIK